MVAAKFNQEVKRPAVMNIKFLDEVKERHADLENEGFAHLINVAHLGKSVNMAIAEGYRRAFSAILDSNLTTIMAALVLMSFGYGPIRGFAITLVIGLVCSMYTAVFVTRVVVDYFIISKGKSSISI